MKSSIKTKQANNKANKINTATQNNGKNLKEQNKLINEIKEVKQNKCTENETRTEILIEQLIKNNYECMVCCYAIRHDTAIWCCPCCNHIFHLFCIKKWARSPVALLDGNLKFPEINLKY
jgi:transcriptional repressor NF-X1